MFGRKDRDRKQKADNPLATRVVRGDDRPTEPLPGAAANPGSPAGDRTISAATTQPATTPISEEPETRLVAPPDTPTNTDGPGEPVGALLIIDGPGSGHLVSFGTGRNGIGRAGGERVCLDFGDEAIADEHHAFITYDDRNGHFYLQPGNGPALTYLDDAPLLEPRRLANGDRFVLGATTLLFRPLVGEDFAWPGNNRPEASR